MGRLGNYAERSHATAVCCLYSVADCLLSTVCCLLIVNWLLSNVCFYLLSIFRCLLSIFFCQLSIVCQAGKYVIDVMHLLLLLVRCRYHDTALEISPVAHISGYLILVLQFSENILL